MRLNCHYLKKYYFFFVFSDGRTLNAENSKRFSCSNIEKSCIQIKHPSVYPPMINCLINNKHTCKTFQNDF